MYEGASAEKGREHPAFRNTLETHILNDLVR